MGSKMWRAAAAGLAAAAVYKMSGSQARTPLRAGLGLLAVGVLGNLALQINTAAKASGTEARLAQHIAAAAPAINLVANGGSIGGTVYVAGDHHVAGTAYGASGTLTVGDNVYTPNALTANGVITSHGGLSASHTTGAPALGSLTGLNGTNYASVANSNPCTASQANAIAARLNNTQDDLAAVVSYLNGGVLTRINDFITALG